MRKPIAVLLAAIGAVGVAPARAQDLSETKTVRLPAGGTVATTYDPIGHSLECASALLARDPLGCASIRHGLARSSVARIQRCLYLNAPQTAQGDSSGMFGYVFAVSGGGSFTLSSLPGGDAPADFDVTFYGNGLGTCEANAPAPTFNFSHLGNEAGVVPAGSTHAIVTLLAGPPDSAFHFEIIA